MKTLNFPIDTDKFGNIIIASGLEALRQKINQKLSLFQGTWFLDITAGVPYLTDILTIPIDAGLIASLINSAILEEKEVTEIGSVSIDYDADLRKFKYAANIYTIYGQTEIII
jgi:hypothetical protein